MEAVIGAVFLQHGIESARASCTTCSTLMDEVSTRGAGLDWKTSLQEIASLAGLGVPDYEVVESGPDHAKTFQARCASTTGVRARHRPEQEGSRAEGGRDRLRRRAPRHRSRAHS